ncbi:hypothetical protein [Nocardia sp. NPDC051833]
MDTTDSRDCVHTNIGSSELPTNLELSAVIADLASRKLLALVDEPVEGV